MSRRGVWRTSNANGHAYRGKAVGRGLRQRSKLVRGLAGVISLEDLERVLAPPAPTTKATTRATGKRTATHA